MIKKQHSIPVPFPPVYPKLWHCLMLHSISPCEKKKKGGKNKRRCRTERKEGEVAKERGAERGTKRQGVI